MRTARRARWSLAALLVGLSAPAVLSGQRPANIVLILADDLGYGDLSAYGADRYETPNIDRLAWEGKLFTDAHSPHPVCTPTRYGLMTGRYSWRTWAGTSNVWSDDPLLIEEGRYTLPMLLKDEGYRTGIVGKWHLGYGRPGSANWSDAGVDYNGEISPGPLEVGFDYYFGIPHVGQQPHVLIENHRVVGLSPDSPLRLHRDQRWIGRVSYLQRFGFPPRHFFSGGLGALYDHRQLAVKLTEEAERWIREQADRPFFLYFAHRDTHGPIAPNERFLGSSGIGPYGDFVLELDWSVGRILDTLDELGLSDDTLVLFSSDNGAVRRDLSGHLVNGPLRGQKTEAYEGGQRVPLLARWPGRIMAGSQSDALIALTDTLATLADLLGRELPPGAGPDSFSFLGPLLDQESTGPMRESLVHNGYFGGYGIRQGDWKLLLFQGGGGRSVVDGVWHPFETDRSIPYGQLYNLRDDLGERRNRFTSEPDRVASMTRLLRRIRSADGSR
ncbi:MAG: arylsulfatase [Bryobacterales bacterium]|nr:arylsulfatase [Bryobacterales bacterium]